MVVLAIMHFPALLLDELWDRFGVGTHFRQIAIQEIVQNVNEKMLFNAVSGCDTVSSCLGHRKKSAWLAWRSCPSVIDAFFDLSLQPVDVSSETLEGIERFLVVMCTAERVQPVESGKSCYAHGSRTMEPNKQTKAALLQHVRRAA